MSELSGSVARIATDADSLGRRERGEVGRGFRPMPGEHDQRAQHDD